VAAWSGLPLRPTRSSIRSRCRRPPLAGRPCTAARARRRAACGCRTPKPSLRSRGTGPPRRRTAGSARGTASPGTLPARPPSWPGPGNRARSSRSRGGIRCRARCAGAAGVPAAPGLFPLHRACRSRRRAGQPRRYRGQCPNLWWPADRAWCVASEIDLLWTYVGGPCGLTSAILADERIEALPAAPRGPGQPCRGLGDRLGRPARRRRQGPRRGPAQHAPRIGPGPAAATARDPQGRARIEVTGRIGNGSSVRPGLRGSGQQLRREVHDYLTFAVLELTGM